MDDKMLEAVKEIKCSICNLLLSVPPIMVAQDGDKSLYKCGRCERILVEKYHWTSNDIFEKIAQNLQLPCSYPPCTELLSWGKVQEHEGNCRHKTIKCPLAANCGCSEMLVDLFGEHAAKIHKASVIKTNTAKNDWKIHTNTTYQCFVELENQYFFVYFKTWRNIAVMSSRWSKYTKFNVTLKIKAEDNCAATVTDLPIIPYNNSIDAYSKHDFMTNISNNVTSVIGSTSNYFIIGITFVADETRDPSRSLKEAEGPEQIPLQLNVETLRKGFSCPYCMTYMAAPIFSCFMGHTICSACKSRLEKCPTCQASLDGPRIFTLEGMAEDVELPCQFKASGCSFAGNTSTLRRHEMECPSSDLPQNN